MPYLALSCHGQPALGNAGWFLWLTAWLSQHEKYCHPFLSQELSPNTAVSMFVFNIILWEAGTKAKPRMCKALELKGRHFKSNSSPRCGLSLLFPLMSLSHFPLFPLLLLILKKKKLSLSLSLLLFRSPMSLKKISCSPLASKPLRPHPPLPCRLSVSV